MRKTNTLFNWQLVEGQDVAGLDLVYTRNARVLPSRRCHAGRAEQAKGPGREAIKALGLRSANLTAVHAEPAGDSVVEIGPSAVLAATSGIVIAS
jgi:hypothetical protein